MSNTKHDLIWINSYEFCVKCKTEWNKLYGDSVKIFDYKEPYDRNEIAINFVNRVNPCLTDEEAMIKNLLE